MARSYEQVCDEGTTHKAIAMYASLHKDKLCYLDSPLEEQAEVYAYVDEKPRNCIDPVFLDPSCCSAGGCTNTGLQRHRML